LAQVGELKTGIEFIHEVCGSQRSSYLKMSCFDVQSQTFQLSTPDFLNIASKLKSEWFEVYLEMTKEVDVRAPTILVEILLDMLRILKVKKFSKYDDVEDNWEWIDDELTQLERFLQNKRNGDLSYHSSKFDEACDYYTRCLSTSRISQNWNSIILGNRAASYFSKHDYLSCVSDCSRSLLKNPSYMKMFKRRGRAYIQITEYEKAKVDFEEYLRFIEIQLEKFSNENGKEENDEKNEDQVNLENEVVEIQSEIFEIERMIRDVEQKRRDKQRKDERVRREAEEKRERQNQKRRQNSKKRYNKKKGNSSNNRNNYYPNQGLWEEEEDEEEQKTNQGATTPDRKSSSHTQSQRNRNNHHYNQHSQANNGNNGGGRHSSSSSGKKKKWRKRGGNDNNNNNSNNNNKENQRNQYSTPPPHRSSQNNNFVSSPVLGSEDPYQVLGISSNASKDEIKKSYKKLALRFHPDKNSSPQASQHFQSIREAYDILGDEENKWRFDYYGIK